MILPAEGRECPGIQIHLRFRPDIAIILKNRVQEEDILRSARLADHSGNHLSLFLVSSYKSYREFSHLNCKQTYPNCEKGFQQYGCLQNQKPIILIKYLFLRK